MSDGSGPASVVEGRRRTSASEPRKSDNKWFGTTPPSWETTRVKYLADYINGYAFSSSQWGSEGRPIVRIQNLTGTDNSYNRFDGQLPSRYMVDPGDLLISWSASLGMHRWTGQEKAWVNQHIYKANPNQDLVRKDYLYWLGLVFMAELEREMHGSAMQHVTQEKLGSLRVPLPPESDQEEIARFLDGTTAKIDDLISKKERLIKLLEEKRTALITRAVTKGLDPDVPMKDSGVEWLHEVPEHWEELTLRSLAQPFGKSFTDGDWVESPHITDSGIRLIQTGNIGVGEYREQGFRYISEESFKELDCTEVFPNDILICRLADPVGRACQAPELEARMITSVDVCILQPRPEVDPEYVVYALSSRPYLTWMASVARGGTRDRVSRSMLGRVKVPMPPQTEQLAISQHLSERCTKLDEGVGTIRTAIERLKEYRSALITAAVTGKIDVREHAA